MPGELEQIASQLGVSVDELRNDLMRQQADAQASAEPLPGGVRDAMLGKVDAKIGKWTVRPCYDGDIQYLSLLEHPLNELRLQAACITASDPKARQEAFVKLWAELIEKTGYRGPFAWQLCYLLTRPLDDVDATFDKGGLDGIKKAARGIFSRVPEVELLAICPVCVNRYMDSWSTMLTHGADVEETSEEGGPTPKASTVLTGLDSSPKSTDS